MEGGSFNKLVWRWIIYWWCREKGKVEEESGEESGTRIKYILERRKGGGGPCRREGSDGEGSGGGCPGGKRLT